MKSRMLLMLPLALLAAAPSFATTATLELFADAGMSSCALSDAPGLVGVYVIHTAGEPASGIQFSAPRPTCWNATWVADNYSTYSPDGSEFGNSQTVAQVAYGVCRTPPAVVVQMLFLSAGATPTCCVYNTLDAQLYADCNFFDEHLLEEGPRTVTINPDASCPCMEPLAIESSTWGRVKSLYR